MDWLWILNSLIIINHMYSFPQVEFSRGEAKTQMLFAARYHQLLNSKNKMRKKNVMDYSHTNLLLVPSHVNIKAVIKQLKEETHYFKR